MKLKYSDLSNNDLSEIENPSKSRPSNSTHDSFEQVNTNSSSSQDDFKTSLTLHVSSIAKFCKKKTTMFLLLVSMIAVVIMITIVGHSPPAVEPLPTPPPPPPPVNIFLQTIRGPSFYRNETLRVRDQYWNQILNRDTKFESPTTKLIIGIIISAGDFQRRSFIRTFQIQPFKDYDIDFRFVLGNPISIYQKAVKYENETYGDLIVLENIGDTRLTGRSLKSYEFYRHVEKNYPQYTHIGRMDSDCFLNVVDFWKLNFNETVQRSHVTIVAAYVDSYFRTYFGKFDWPQGSFYVMTRDLMLIINKFHELVPKMVEEEDCQLAWYLFDAEINYTKVALDPSTSYDFNIGLPGWVHDISNDTIKVHELKKDEEYLTVANCFNEKGVNTTMISLMRNMNWTVPHD